MTRRRLSFVALPILLVVVAPAAAQTTVPGGTISVDTTWSLAGSPYVITGNLTVAGTDGGDGVTTLTIEPGVEVRMQGYRTLYVGSSSGGLPGALIADGDAAGGPATITFRSDSATPGVGDWPNIYFQTEARDISLLRNVLIRHGGAGSFGAVYLKAKAGTMLTLEDVTIEQPARYGIYQQYCDSTLSGITIVDPGDSGIHLYNATSTLSQVSISGGSNHAIDFYGTVDFSLDGCSLGANGNHDIRIGSSVTGTVQNCSSIESVYYEPYSTVTWSGNTFDNWGARVSRINAGDLGGLIADNTINKVGGASVEVTTSTIVLDSTWTDAAGAPYVVKGSFYVEGDDGPDGVTTLQIEPGLELRFDGTHHLYVGGTSAAVPGALIADGDAAGGPATITFTSYKPSPAAGDWGSINLRAGARGNSLLRNVLIEYGGYGSWASVYMQHGAGVNITLENVTIRDSGGYGIYQYRGDVTGTNLVIQNTGYSYGFYISGGQTTLSDLSISGAATNGVYVYNNVFTVDGCTLGSNGAHDILVGNYSDLTVLNCSSIESIYHDSGSAVASFAGNTFNNWGDRVSRVAAGSLGGLIADNTINKAPGATVEVSVGTVTQDAEWTDAAGHPYTVLGSVTVQGADGGDGVTTLTLQPGLVLRGNSSAVFNIGGGTTAVPGALVADGDGPGGPATIVFTSNSLTPAAGDWQNIYFRSGARENSILRNVLLEYGGLLHATLKLYHPAGTTIPVENVTIRDGNNDGIREGSGDVTMHQVTVTDVGAYGINLGAGSATLDEITITGAGQYGLWLASYDIDLDTCAIHSNGNHDIYVANAVASGTIQNCSSLESFYYSGATHDITWAGNTFNSWGARTSKITANEVGRLATLNTFNAVPGAFLEVTGGTLTYDATWTPEPGPYVNVTATGLTVQGTDGPDGVTTLHLDPGVAIKFLNGGGVSIGAGAGDPGELIVDGRLGGDAFSTVNFTSAKAPPSSGDWAGIVVNGTGRAEFHEAQIRYAVKGIHAYAGNLGAVDRLTVNRAGTGLDLYNAMLEEPVTRTTFKNCDIAVEAYRTDATFRNSDLVGATWGVENESPASHCIDAAMNWWNATNGPSGDPPLAGCELDEATGIGSPISEAVLFDGWLDAPSDDGDGIPCDDGDGYFDPCNRDNLVDCDDNCCIVANASQEDVDSDGVGDACDDNPVLRVSTDPADGADFEVVQEAVDAAFQSGTRVEIFPGLGPYTEAVRLDRLPPQVFSIRGLETGGGPVVVDGGGGPAFNVLDMPVGVIPMRFDNLTLQGAQGIHALVDTELIGLTFEMIAMEALKLDAGNHEIDRCEIRDSVTTGVDVAAEATAHVSRTTMTGQSNAGLVVAGTAALENVLIDNGADGVRVAATGSADVLYSTIVDNTGAGIDNTLGGALTMDRSIVHGNIAGDILPSDVGFSCPTVTWSDTGSPDCSASGNNISVDPLFDMDYRLSAGSACLDHGPDPATYTGEPPTDLAGAWRLADHDGDGMAESDPGAYERVNESHVPGEVENVSWDSGFRIVWDAEPDAVEYHVYRDLLSNLSLAGFGLCSDPLDADRTDTQWDELDEPAIDQGFFYLVTADSGSDEGTLGFGETVERSNYDSCVP